MKHLIILPLLTLLFLGCDSKNEKRIDWSDAPLAPKLDVSNQSKNDKNKTSIKEEVKIKRIDWSDAPTPTSL